MENESDGRESVPEEDAPENLATLSASVQFSNLSKNAHALVEQYANPKPHKITVRFKAIGSAPMLQDPVCTVSSNQQFKSLAKFLRIRLKIKKHESIFMYVNQSFSPALDEVVGNVFENFAVDGKLMVSYCNTVAFG